MEDDLFKQTEPKDGAECVVAWVVLALRRQIRIQRRKICPQELEAIAELADVVQRQHEDQRSLQRRLVQTEARS